MDINHISNKTLVINYWLKLIFEVLHKSTPKIKVLLQVIYVYI